MYQVPSHLIQSSKQSFELQLPVQFLKKLEWDVTQLSDLEKHLDIRSVYQSINCAITAWHMTDWVFQFMTDGQRANFTPARAAHLPEEIARSSAPDKAWRQLKDQLAKAQLNQFRRRIMKASDELRICRYVADTSKHRLLTHNPDYELQATTVSWNPDGGATWQFPLVFDGPKQHRLPELMHRAHRFWTIYIRWLSNSK